MAAKKVGNLPYKIFLLMQSFPRVQQTGQYCMKFLKNYRTTKVIQHLISPSLLAVLFLVKADSKQKITGKVIEEADRLYNDGKFDELYSVLESHNGSDNPEILWRLARAIFEKCHSIKEDNKKLQYLEQALEFVDSALHINEECWAAHKWRAILLDYVWRYKSTKGRIIHSFDVKKHIERAIELNPTDSTSFYLLGEWCFTFAEMPWYQRKIAAAIFASPPTSTYEEALENFKKAEEITPLFYSMNLLMLGKCYINLNNKEKGMKYLKKAVEYTIKIPDDQKAHDEAEKLLKDLNA
ncbi:regulator of microtubule dynamics protein 1 [Trichonephila clavipes]|nr:regulator of microtubule dynamics protein 1 [Trichonephila clavipes]